MPKTNYQSRLFGTIQTTALLMLASGVLAQGVSGSRYPISGVEIAKELGSIGVSIDASQIHLPVNMTAAVASPRLEVAAAEPLGVRQVRLELRCPAVSECLRFLATLDVENADRMADELRLKAGSHETAALKNEKSGPQVRLGVGARAVLTMRDDHMDIHLQVLAIDSGSVGQQVRVCTLDRKKVFHATVTGEGTVTGVME